MKGDKQEEKKPVFSNHSANSNHNLSLMELLGITSPAVLSCPACVGNEYVRHWSCQTCVTSTPH